MENQGSKKKLQKYCLRLYSIPLMMESSNYDASWTRNHDYSTKTKKITCNIAEKRVKLIRTFSNLAKKNINKNEAEWPLLLKSNIQIQPKKKKMNQILHAELPYCITQTPPLYQIKRKRNYL